MFESLRWKLRRASVMTAAEVRFRMARAAKLRLERAWGSRVTVPPARGTCGHPLAPEMGKGIDPAPYVAAADRILAGGVRAFGIETIGFPPRWNRCPRTGRVAPLTFGKLLDYRDAAIVGDIKYLWEPNRHLELVTLAQAWHLSGEERFLTGAGLLLRSWLDACPHPLGPNWASALEQAIRLTNWSLAWHLLGGDTSPMFDTPDGAELRRRWLDSVYLHLRFIAGHLSLHSSANNHLLGEYLGLLAGALTWPLWPQAEAWVRTGHAGFAREALRQTAPDGVNREQASYYQHHVMEMMTLAGLLGRAHDRDFGPEFWQRLEHMCDYLAAIMDVAGQVPTIGDADDGRFVRLDPAEDMPPYRSLLATGAILFDRGDLAAKAERLDDRTRWLLPGRALPDASAAPPVTAFPQGGYYLLGDRLETAEEVRLVCDCGPLGYLGIAAHGHADALAFTLSAGGVEWLVDPGTYAYHGDRTWRDHFRGTGAHNTVLVDALDQSQIGGDFLWLDKAGARLIRHDPLAGVFEGEHDGYRRLPDPVTHRRCITIADGGATIRVRDTLICEGRHRIDISFQFAEACAVRIEGSQVTARQAGREMTLDCGHPAFAPALLHGQDTPPAGWVSRRFGEKRPATMARWSGNIAGTTVVETIIRLTPATVDAQGFE